LFPHLDSGKYDSFVDVFFRTGNFYFFLNLPNNLLNILNLPVYGFYRYIQKGNSQKIYDYVYNHCKKELNKFFLKYEQDTTNDVMELEVAQNYYFLTKGSYKQTIKFKNKEVVSLFNQYVTKVESDKKLKDFYTILHITKSNILYYFDYENILNKCDGENIIIFIDNM
jgi:site-specific DNA-adenine methylase